jgi:hypothetical protein
LEVLILTLNSKEEDLANKSNNKEGDNLDSKLLFVEMKELEKSSS